MINVYDFHFFVILIISNNCLFFFFMLPAQYLQLDKILSAQNPLSPEIGKMKLAHGTF